MNLVVQSVSGKLVLVAEIDPPTTSCFSKGFLIRFTRFINLPWFRRACRLLLGPQSGSSAPAIGQGGERELQYGAAIRSELCTKPLESRLALYE
jgi:hypothetical protein